MKKCLFLFAAILMIYGPEVYALPQLINYQGSLTRPDGSPLDTTVSMTFTINYAPSGGVPLWTETQPAVVVANGLFAVQLGSVSPPLPDVFNTTTWLGIAVGGDAEMTPRQPINSVAYSYRVGTVDGASGGTIGGDVAVNGKGKFGINTTNSGQGTFVAGQSSHADATYSSVTGGTFNWALGNYSHVGGGQQNQAGDGTGPSYQTVSGGVQNYALGLASTVGGGFGNRARGNYSFIGGGGGAGADSNSASGAYSAIGGGYRNTAGDSGAAVGGGQGNAVLPGGVGGAIGGGVFNTASDTFSTISGGRYNRASAGFATVAGGDSNLASGHSGTVGGGQFNTALGYASIVPGGYDNHADGDYSFCAGRTAWTSQAGCFLWADASGTGITTSLPNSFRALASGGVYFRTSSTANIGALLDAGSGAWQNICDVNKKRVHGDVNTAETLQKVVNLPLYRWSYKSQSDQVQHIGPTAQDFHAAFQLGESDTTINTLDPDGVALAAIQELAKQNAKKDEDLSALRGEVAELRGQLQSVMAQQQHSFNQNQTKGNPE